MCCFKLEALRFGEKFFAFSKKMSEKNVVVFKSKSFFNLVIILIESNYDVWSQLVEMHIAEQEKFSYIRGKTKQPKESEYDYEK